MTTKPTGACRRQDGMPCRTRSIWPVLCRLRKLRRRRVSFASLSPPSAPLSLHSPSLPPPFPSIPIATPSLPPRPPQTPRPSFRHASSASRPFIKRSKIIILRTKISSLPPHERPERPRRRSGITFSGETSTIPILGIILRAKIRLGRARRFFSPHHWRAENYLTHLILTPPANACAALGGGECSRGASTSSLGKPCPWKPLPPSRPFTAGVKSRASRREDGVRDTQTASGTVPGVLPDCHLAQNPTSSGDRGLIRLRQGQRPRRGRARRTCWGSP